MFEVTHTDLAARLGKLTIGSKRVDTPAFLPVVHPIRQEVPSHLLSSMGFQIVITNAYITMKKFPHGVDIHSQIGFDGVVMTDSGGYQLLEYGKLDAKPDQIAEYQKKIGSDIAVILDTPTGYPADRAHAEATVTRTLAAAKESSEIIGSKPPLWAGPVQGGVYSDLVKYSAKEISKFPFDIFAIGSPVELMNNYRFKDVSSLIQNAKAYLPLDKPVHLFGAGHPFIIPLAVALGCDLFDSASYILFAKRNSYMTTEGVRRLDEMTDLPCSCSICSSTNVKELIEMPKDERIIKIAVHNLNVIRAELAMTREAIREGRLWSYLMRKIRTHPKLFDSFHFSKRTLDEMEQGSMIGESRALMLFDSNDLICPEVTRHLKRMIHNYRPGSKKLTLYFLQNDWDRAYRYSLAKNMTWDKAFFHPFFSMVPAELLQVYPLSQNVFPERVDRKTLRVSLRNLVNLVKLYSLDNVELVYDAGQRNIALRAYNLLKRYKGREVSIKPVKYT
ncbi:MAG: tRNA guanosine(15) transglycosylase TgtA [Nitrososphaerota archaeon]